MDISWKFRWTFWPGNYIWSLSIWIWTQMGHLGTLIPRFCTEFRYLSHVQSGLAWAAIFEKMPEYYENFFFQSMHVHFSRNRFPNAFFPMRPRQPLAIGSSRGGAPRKCRGIWGGAQPWPRMIYLYCYFILQYFQIHRLYQNGWSFSISRKAGYIRMVGPSVFPEKEVISEWLVLQYFQTHRSKIQFWEFKLYIFWNLQRNHIFRTIPFDLSRQVSTQELHAGSSL